MASEDADDGLGAGRLGPGNEAELELGLSLGKKVVADGRAPRSCGTGLPRGDCCRILPAEDYHSPVPASHGSPISSSSSTASSSPPVGTGDEGGGRSGAAGTKRTADSVSPGVGSQGRIGRVVGWPPVRAYRMNSVINHQPKDCSGGNDSIEKDSRSKIADHAANKEQKVTKVPAGSSLFVKVNMDGMPIGRKVDLRSHSTYEDLAMALEAMFQRPNSMDRSLRSGKKSHLLGGSSGFILIYEDMDGDWMLVGDVPWEMFLSTAQRLRIMRSSDDSGFAAGLLHGPRRTSTSA